MFLASSSRQLSISFRNSLSTSALYIYTNYLLDLPTYLLKIHKIFNKVQKAVPAKYQVVKSSSCKIPGGVLRMSSSE